MTEPTQLYEEIPGLNEWTLTKFQTTFLGHVCVVMFQHPLTSTGVKKYRIVSECPVLRLNSNDTRMCLDSNTKSGVSITNLLIVERYDQIWILKSYRD